MPQAWLQVLVTDLAAHNPGSGAYQFTAEDGTAVELIRRLPHWPTSLQQDHPYLRRELMRQRRFQVSLYTVRLLGGGWFGWVSLVALAEWRRGCMGDQNCRYAAGQGALPV